MTLFLTVMQLRRWAARALLVAASSVMVSLSQAQSVNLEIACFRGGYGIDFYEKCAREYEALKPDVKINLWGSPRVWDQLTPRFAAGTPPDICFPGWGMNVFSLIFDSQLLPLDKYLDQPAWEADKAWRDTFAPAMLKKGAFKDKHYTLPYNLDAFGWWYNRRMFRDNGWEPPQTYEELLKLCEQIRKKRIAPVTFTGRYSQYMLDGFFYPWAYRAGGQEVLKLIDNLEPGAWKHPAFVKAAETIMEMKKLGNFQAGCIGMNHTESQMEFLVGRAAMIPNGTWLYSEMKQLLPPDFEMEYMRCPVFAEGVGDPFATKASYDGKGWCITTKSKHPDVAADFLRYMTSAKVAERMMQAKGTLVAITDVSDAHVPEHLKQALRYMRESKTDAAVLLAEWYPELGTAVQNAIRSLYNEVLTPAQFTDQLEKAADAMRRNPQLQKFGRD